VARQILSRIASRALSGKAPGLFTRFTPRARAAVVHAQEAARRLRHRFVGTEHVLLGLMAEPEGIAARALAELGVDEAAVELAVTGRVGVGKEEVGGHIPFSPRAKKTLELALREALALKHNYIGTEHILLGLLRAGGVAVEVLAERGATAEQIRPTVMRLLAEAVA
jgi:ATP-dependent Clp protease ATP-binding subunit ClpC